MTLLRHNRWRNATTDELISDLQNKITDLSAAIILSTANYNKCKNAGMLYSCVKNTGKTQSSWYETGKDQQALMVQYQAELARLVAIRQSNILAAQNKATTDIVQASASTAQATASAATSKKWILIGAGVVGIIGLSAFIYLKIIKKK